MAGKSGQEAHRRSDAYRHLLMELQDGPKTREYLMNKLAKYVPFEKAIRKAETDRLSRSKRDGRTPGPRKKNRSLDEQVYYGRRSMINQILGGAVANNRIVRIPGEPDRDTRTQPNDLFRLHTEDDPINERNLRKAERNRERRVRLKRARESEEAEKAAGDHGRKGRTAARS